MVSEWPKAQKSLIAEEAEMQMELIKQVTTSLRTIRAELRIAPSAKIDAVIKANDQEKLGILREYGDYVTDLASVSVLTCGTDVSRPKNSALAVESQIEICVPLEGLVDVEQEQERLRKEIQSVQKDIERAEAKLARKDFLNKAPRDIVEKERNKLSGFQAEEEKLKQQLNQITP